MEENNEQGRGEELSPDILRRALKAFKKRLKKERWPVSRLHRLEQRARALPDGKPAERVRRAIGKLYDLPTMVRELEAWKQLKTAVEADDPEGADDPGGAEGVEARAAYEAVVKAHARTEAGRRARARLTWMD